MYNNILKQNDNIVKIDEIAKKLSISNNIEKYGEYKAKINLDSKILNKKGELILVTSTSPTKYGEGKTTLCIGISDALNKLGYKSTVVLREPSLGPVFGIKGGATGGGKSIVIPEADINLHFTGDMHAITSANNLISAAIDNHIYQGNLLNIKEVLFKRCLDVNDRALKNVNLGTRLDSFTITAASEIMAIVCLSKDLDDLKYRLSNIIIGYDINDNIIYLDKLNIVDSLVVLLYDAMKPNLVQTLENNPAIVHGGPFANIAHGTNSLVSTNLALGLSDYAIVEAGFGSDMGALKFLDIKCRLNGLNPKVVVINTTTQSILYNGEDFVSGLSNLEYHIKNMKSICSNVLVVLNHFENDLLDNINLIENLCNKEGVSFSISKAYSMGSSGAIDVANKILKFNNNIITYPYDINDDIEVKINKFCKKYLYAKEVVFTDEAKEKLNKFSSFNNLPICIAKTQYSISDDPKKLGFPKDNIFTVTDLCINNGAGFITVYMGNILTMPGLPKVPNYEKIKILNNEIINL